METATVVTDGTSRRTFRSTVLPWVVLVMGIPVAFLLFMFIQHSVESVARLRFEREANDANDIIEGSLRSYSDVLYALRALFASETPIDRLRFHHFIESLNLKHRYPGFDSLNYAAHVLAKDKERFEQTVRRDTSMDPQGYPRFAIKPAGERSEYYVVVYLEPMAGYEFAFGLDISANPAASNPEKLIKALHLARDSGELIASGQPLRIKREKEIVYLAMRIAVYRNGMPTNTVEQRRIAYVGSVGAGLDVENLMKGAFNEGMPRYLRIRLYDAGIANDDLASRLAENKRLLFDSDQLSKAILGKSSIDTIPVFVHVLPVKIAGRIWEFEYSAQKDSIISDTDRLLPALVLAGGLLSTLLLFGMLYSLASSHRRAVAIAGEITKDLRESEISLAEAQHIAHLGNWSVDPATGNMTWSEEAYRILGLKPRPGPFACADFQRRVHEDDRAVVRRTFRRAIATRQDCEIDCRILLDDGRVRWVHAIAQPTRSVRRSPISGTLMDITERKRAEQALLESRALLNDAQKLSHVGCWQYHPHDRRLIWSEEVYRIFGVDARTFGPSYETVMNLVHPEDRPAGGDVIDKAVQAGGGYTIEFRIVQPAGAVRYIRTLGEVVNGERGRPAMMLGAILDITEQKRAEDALRAYAEQLTGLSRRLVEVQESERRQFSRELHDRIGQNLTALSINLDILKSQLSGDGNAGIRLRLDDSSALLESTSGSVENLLSELRPPMLDDYGLLSALQWYGNEFAGRTGIDVKVRGDERMDRLSAATEIALFRIAQEALNNVAKHARAHFVDITLERSGMQCIMSVADDGIGFDGESSANSKRRSSLGMVTMRERTQTIGGHFEVGAAPGGGTRVAVQVPC